MVREGSGSQMDSSCMRRMHAAIETSVVKIWSLANRGKTFHFVCMGETASAKAEGRAYADLGYLGGLWRLRSRGQMSVIARRAYLKLVLFWGFGLWCT